MRIFFYGNCQAKSLHDAYAAHILPVTGGVAGWAHSAAPLSPTHYEAIAAAEVVVLQAAPFMPREDITPRLRAGARVLHVPVAGNAFLWPYCGTPHPDSQTRYGKYHPFTAEHADSWLLKRLKRGGTAEQAVAEYMALDAHHSARVARRAEMEFENLRAREAGTGFAAADFIAANFQATKLFRTPYHMTLPMARFMALRFFEILGVPDAAMARARDRMLDDFYIKSELPVHPSIAAGQGLAWAQPGTRYRFYMETLLTDAAFYLRFARCEAYPEAGQAHQAAIRGAEGAQALVDDALAKVPDSPWLAQAQAMLCLRAGKAEEGLAWALKARAAYPELWMINAHIADCLDALGRAEEAEAALRAELARNPYIFRLHASLAARQEKRGAFAQAAETIEQALQLEPAQPELLGLRARLSSRAQQTVHGAS